MIINLLRQVKRNKEKLETETVGSEFGVNELDVDWLIEQAEKAVQYQRSAERQKARIEKMKTN